MGRSLRAQGRSARRGGDGRAFDVRLARRAARATGRAGRGLAVLGTVLSLRLTGAIIYSMRLVTVTPRGPCAEIYRFLWG